MVVKGGRRVSLITPLPFVSRLSRKCRGLDVSQSHGPPRLVTRIAVNFSYKSRIFYLLNIIHRPHIETSSIDLI
jgi:hypothetical protein